jgi:CheY-like chemotaxis protein
MIDPKTNMLVWRGVVKDTVSGIGQSDKQANEAAKDLVKRFIKDSKKVNQEMTKERRWTSSALRRQLERRLLRAPASRRLSIRRAWTSDRRFPASCNLPNSRRGKGIIMPHSMKPSRSDSILSVEDHPVFREGLSTIIASQEDMVLVAQAVDAVEAVAEYRRHRPDITLMDLRLPGTNGTDTLIQIRGEFPQARIIMLTTSDSDGEIQRALRAGASGYVLKSMPKNDLLKVIRLVHAGGRHIRLTLQRVLPNTWVKKI